MLKLYTNVVTGKTYDENGDLFEDGLPTIFYKSTAKIAWQLCSETPDIAEGSDDTPETAWTKCTDYAQYQAVGAFLTADDNYIKRRQGTLSASVSAGAVSTIEATVSDADFDTIPSSGVIELFDSEGESEVVKYNARSIEDGVVTFTLATGSTVERSYESGSPMDCSDEPLMQAALDGQNSDVANGLFCFKIRAFSRKLHDLVAYSNTKEVSVMGLELAVFRIDSESNFVVDLERYEVDTFSIRTGLAETSANPPLTDDEANETVTICNTLLAAGFSLQFSNNNTSWHDTQVTTGETIDVFFRFRSAGSGGTWSNGIRLVKGDPGAKGDDGDSAYVYVRYASDNQGTGFSATPSDSLPYIGVLATDTAIANPSASDFDGLWSLYIGPKGDPGTPGTNGTRGTKTYFGTAVTGTSTTAAVFDTDIEDALAGDCYVNTSTLNLYECTLGGADTVATWKYVNTLKGTPGASKYQYIAYASNSSGSGFSMTPSDSLPYIAFKNSDTEITNPSASDFTGLWTKFHGNDGTSSYTYVAYASNSSGSNFSLTPSDSLKYRAEIHTTTPIPSPSSSNFSGATWVKYLGDPGSNGTRGSRINYGTSITGTSTTPTAYATGISDSLINDQYINTDTLNLFRCTTAGNASTAKWVYVDSMKGTPAEAALEGVKLNGAKLTPVDKVVDAHALPFETTMPTPGGTDQDVIFYGGETISGDTFTGNLITYDHTERPGGMTMQIVDNTKTGTERQWSGDDPLDNIFYIKYSDGNWILAQTYDGSSDPPSQIGSLRVPVVPGQPWGQYMVNRNGARTWTFQTTTGFTPATKGHAYERDGAWSDSELTVKYGNNSPVTLKKVSSSSENYWTDTGTYNYDSCTMQYDDDGAGNGHWVYTNSSGDQLTSPAFQNSEMPWDFSGAQWTLNGGSTTEVTVKRSFNGGWADIKMMDDIQLNGKTQNPVGKKVNIMALPITTSMPTADADAQQFILYLGATNASHTKAHLYEKNATVNDGVLTITFDGLPTTFTMSKSQPDAWINSGDMISLMYSNGCWTLSGMGVPVPDYVLYSPQCPSTTMPWELSGETWSGGGTDLVTFVTPQSMSYSWTDLGSILSA